jgi:large subunit ribosomal protein L3
MKGLIGRKVGMSQVFNDSGKVVPITYIYCEPSVVLGFKTVDNDGYDAVVFGYSNLGGKAKKNKKFRIMKEFRGDTSGFSVGDKVSVDSFLVGDFITLVGVSKGKGFQGRVRLHNANVARKTHGTKAIRHGSSGSICITARSQKGLKMAGRMGVNKITLKNKGVVIVDAERSLLAVKGSVPGSINSIVFLNKS